MSATPTEARRPARHAPASPALREGGDRIQCLIAAGGILGALGAASCCVIPFALFLAGVSGAWIGNLTALEPYQPIFASASLGFIGAGAWRLYRGPKQACSNGYCATPRSDQIAKICLWAAGALVALALGFPSFAGHFL